MGFRDREKRRLAPLKERLFSEKACEWGTYRRRTREFCLSNERAKENLHPSIRDEALLYFEDRGIGWHHGIDDGPSNHLCCSQSCCVNFWMPFVYVPDRLALVLQGLGYDVAEVLPYSSDRVGSRKIDPYVAFEWIGERNYLGELARGKVASDRERTRGAGFTSLDFAFKFRRSDGSIQIVAGEWKYTENYTTGRDLRYSRSGTDRLEIYRPWLEHDGCQIVLCDVRPEALFFDPFDQLMRQQLLCSSMERHREMGADIVSLIHVAPAANRELIGRLTSPGLRAAGSDIHEIWSSLVTPGHFRGVHVEDVLSLVCEHAPDPEWARYMRHRYGGMR